MKRIVFTREHPLQDELVERLNDAGYIVEHAPLIKCQVNAIPNRAYQRIDENTWVFFTSQVAVDLFFEEAKGYFDTKAFKIATIGPKTSETVQKWGFQVTFESDKFYAKDLVEDWTQVYTSPETIFIPQSSLASKTLEKTLLEKGHDVLAWVMYETVHNEIGQQRVQQLNSDVSTIWTFASGSAWDSFYAVRQELPKTDLIAVIGTTTQASVERDGHCVAFRPYEPQIELMIQTILDNERIDE